MSIKLLTKFFILSATLLLMACGGGGGGGQDEVVYSGLTTPAAVDDTNATTLTEGIIGGSQTGTAFGVVSEADEARARPTILDVARIISNSVTQLDLTAPSAHLPGAIVTDSGSEACLDGGSLSYDLRIDDVTFEFSGTFNYNDCAEGDTTLDGRASASGSLGGASEEFNLSFDPLTVASGAESYTMAGSINISAVGSSATISMNVRLKNNNTGSVEWLNNLSISVTDSISFVQMSVSGRYYHPQHGYVDIVTNTPFQIGSADQWPSTGQMTITGASGSKARVTAFSNTQYTLEVDADGDDVYELTTTEDWE